MNLDPRQQRALRAGAVFVASAAFMMLGGCKMNDEGLTVNSKTGESKGGAPHLAVAITVAEEPRIGDGLTLEAVFENRGETAQTVITPQDGSFEGWLSPVYDVAVKKAASEKRLDVGGRCGNHGGRYDERTMKVVKPGERLSVRLVTPYLFTDPGNYTATLRYAVKPNAYPGERYDAPSPTEVTFGAWPTGTFVGEAASSTIGFTVKKP